MNRGTLTIILSIFVPCTVALYMTLAARRVSGQSPDAQTSAQVYNPYPPGILPSDLNPEIERVRRELRVLEGRALARWRALKPPVLTGQPPTLQDTGTEAVETLGELMNYDQNISPSRNQACSFCHMPYAGFSGPVPSVNLTMIAYPGTVHFRAARRTAQQYTYAPSLPLLHSNQ